MKCPRCGEGNCALIKRNPFLGRIFMCMECRYTFSEKGGI